MSSAPDEQHDPISRERRISLELKYAAIAIGVLGLLVIVHWVDALSGVNNTLSSSVNAAASFGAIGLFVIALVANATVIIQIPYTLQVLLSDQWLLDLPYVPGQAAVWRRVRADELCWEPPQFFLWVEAVSLCCRAQERLVFALPDPVERDGVQPVLHAVLV